MNLSRTFNFIYFGFVGDSGERQACGTDFHVLKRILNEYEIAIKHGERLANDEYRALMSVDIMYRFSNRHQVGDESSSRWPIKYNFLRNVSTSRYNDVIHEFENIQFDLEQIYTFCGYYRDIGDNDEGTKKLTTFLDDHYKVPKNNVDNTLADIEKNDDESLGNIKKFNEERSRGFIKGFVSLLNLEIKGKSVTLNENFKEEHSHYITTAIALKLMSEISKKKPPSESGVKFLYDELFLFYVELMRKDILSKRTEELFDRLQAFIDMFIIGVCYNKKQQVARKTYISGIIDSALSECVNLKVEGVREGVRQFVDEYKHMFFEYMSNNRFKMYAGKKWYNELYHLAEKDKEYFGFITTVMSFLPRKSNDVKKIMALSKKALGKRAKEKEKGKRIQLNVQIDSGTMMKLEELEVELGKKRLDIVIQAVKLLHKLHIRGARSPGPDSGVKPDQTNSIPADEKQGSNSRRIDRPQKASAWNNKRLSSNNEIQDAPHASALLDSVDGASTAPLEVPQCHQPPTSTELPASDVVENEGEGVDTPNPKSDASAALQELNKKLG